MKHLQKIFICFFSLFVSKTNTVIKQRDCDVFLKTSIMAKYSILLFFSFVFNRSFSQAMFENTFGNAIDVERGHCAKQTYDKGYIVLGTNTGDETGSGYTVLIKTDSLGNQIWSKGLFDFGLFQSWASSLKITADSGFVITGGSINFGGDIGTQDVFLLKTDKNGNQQWVETYDSIDSYPSAAGFDEHGNDVILTNDGGYLIAGQAGSKELILLKTDSFGNKQWVSKDTVQSQASGTSLIQAENNNYVVIGSTTPNAWNTPKIYLAKYNFLGNKTWGQTYSWSGGNYSLGYSVKVNPDGEYILLGLGRYNSSTYGEMLMIKTDTAGNFMWENSFLKNTYTSGYAIENTNDNGYILTGYSFDTIIGYRVYLVKTDSVGVQVWDTVCSGDMGFSVEQTLDNGYVIAGTKMNDVYLLKIGAPLILSSATNFLNSENVVSIYPNPSSGVIKMLLKTQNKIQFDIEIVDLYGRKINSRKNLDSNSEIFLERNLFSEGVNLIKIKANGKLIFVRKVVVN